MELKKMLKICLSEEELTKALDEESHYKRRYFVGKKDRISHDDKISHLCKYLKSERTNE